MFTNLILQAEQNAAAGAAIGLVIVQFIIALVTIIGAWKAFSKAGQPGWGSLIPIFNTYLMIKIAKKDWWFLLLLFVPIVNIIIAIMVINGVSKNFNKGIGTTLGLIFLPFIFWPILGFGSAEYSA